MMKIMQRAVVCILLCVIFVGAPTSSFAYTYGDANMEDVAETFKVIAASLNKDAPDWKSIDAAYQTRRSEISSHFGEAIALTLDENLKAKDAEQFLANYKAVLVMNLDRRFDYAIVDVSDYTKAKMLLAKAKATYETLEPFIGDSATITAANAAFDLALKALGNPGLFGVGKVESNPDEFVKQVNSIYNGIEGSFPFTAYKEVIVEEKPVPVPEDNSEPEVIPVEEVLPTAVEEVTETDNDLNPPLDVDMSEEEDISISTDNTDTSETGEDDTSTPERTEDTTAVAFGEDHAPMTRTDKTNPVITFVLIGGLIILAVVVLWFVRKQGLLK